MGRKWTAPVAFGYMTDDFRQVWCEADHVYTTEEWGVSLEKIELWESMGYVIEVFE